MDDTPLRYSAHARRKMIKDRIAPDDIASIISWPTCRIVSPDCVEHHGYADDGRLLTVVTDRTEALVITVVDQERRRRERRKRR